MDRTNGLSPAHDSAPPTVNRPTPLPVGARVDFRMRVVAVEQRDSEPRRIHHADTWRSRGKHLDVALLAAGSSLDSTASRPERRRAVVGEVGQFRGRRQLKVSSVVVLPRGAVDWRDLLPVRRFGQHRTGRRSTAGGRGDPRARGSSHARSVLCRCGLPRPLRGRVPPAPPGTTPSWAVCCATPARWPPSARAIARTCRRGSAIWSRRAPCSTTSESSKRIAGMAPSRPPSAGSLLGHVTLGMLMLDRRLRRRRRGPVHPERANDLLQHLIASHHGRQEFGAAVAPMTLEAEILHYADNASAKSASMADGARRCRQLRRETRSLTARAALAARPSAGIPRQE